MQKTTHAALLFAVALAAAACEDPSADKAQAAVSSAKPVSSAATGAAYEIASDSSKLEFIGSKVTGKHEGGFKKISGTARLAGEAIEGGSVAVSVDAKSVYSDADGLTKHLQNDDFFDVANHPEAKFVSTEIKKGGSDGASHTVTGNLTLRGKTNSISFPATIAMKGDAISVVAEFSINRKDFGIMYAGKEDDLIRDGVVIKLDLTLKKS